MVEQRVRGESRSRVADSAGFAREETRLSTPAKRLSPGRVLAVVLLVFAISVAALSAFGSRFLDRLKETDITTGYIDLARQHSLKRQNLEAEAMYKAAVRQSQSSGDSELQAHALAVYAEFLRKSKRPEEAMGLELKAKRLQGIIK